MYYVMRSESWDETIYLFLFVTVHEKQFSNLTASYNQFFITLLVNLFILSLCPCGEFFALALITSLSFLVVESLFLSSSFYFCDSFSLRCSFHTSHNVSFIQILSLRFPDNSKWSLLLHLRFCTPKTMENLKNVIRAYSFSRVSIEVELESVRIKRSINILNLGYKTM